ncbi:MAG: hypothetical protein HOP19_16650 [Acidobacteria bacterium]|nr:hypothetical protein [Acidobacteriota bacterium]
MLIYPVILLGLAFICSVTIPVYAQSSDWTELSLPNNANLVSALYANGNTVLAARSRSLQNVGVYRSTDRGQSWTEISGFEKNLDGSMVWSFVAANGAIYATGRGVMRSLDDGLTWTPLNNGLRTRFEPNVAAPIGYLAVNGHTLAAAVLATYQSVFISTDGGANWSEQLTGLPFGLGFGYGPLAFSEGNLLMQVAGPLYRYRPDTRSWTTMNANNPYFERNSLMALGKNYYGIGTGAGRVQQVFRSSDGGANWTGFVRGLPMGSFIADFSRVLGLTTDGNWFYVMATAGGNSPQPSGPVPSSLYFSDDEGETWGLVGKPLGFEGAFLDRSFPNPLAVSGADVYVASGTKLYRTTLQAPVVSSASYRALDVTRGGIATVFGANLTMATSAASADASIAEVTVQVTDSAGQQRNAFVFFASPGQINFQIPPETATGLAAVTLAGTNQAWRANVYAAAPSLFTADASGKGLPAGVALRVKADGTQSYEPLYQLDTQNKLVAVPLDVSRVDETVFLVLFGTGLRGRSELAKVTARIGNVNIPVDYAGPTPGFIGLDQANLRLPRSLTGRGEAEIELQADGKKANAVKISFR